MNDFFSQKIIRFQYICKIKICKVLSQNNYTSFKDLKTKTDPIDECSYVLFT